MLRGAGSGDGDGADGARVVARFELGCVAAAAGINLLYSKMR